eukprot:CAMPEP_0114135936 /NCGR_PEP_ID=MMETSP0043_2-20121206/14948_1 /TAXON_ID=464988 /ORGANISM="Hemiselmis andersenii, Strain CCMP644" /LENGTH=195 /DNA_ID=CAMNT_0001229659 /DNA_START=119 /DNA_END=703 /DNA_ORIENTATION=+
MTSEEPTESIPFSISSPPHQVAESLPSVPHTPQSREMPPPSTVPMCSWAVRSGEEDKEERDVLEASSLVAGTSMFRVFGEEDTQEDRYSLASSGGERWTDPCGFPSMTPGQMEVSAEWVRASNLSGAAISGTRSHRHVKQSMSPDCSVISSLIVCRAWELKWGLGLVTSNIFPQRDGVPVLSESGRYGVRMFING